MKKGITTLDDRQVLLAAQFKDAEAIVITLDSGETIVYKDVYLELQGLRLLICNKDTTGVTASYKLSSIMGIKIFIHGEVTNGSTVHGEDKTPVTNL